MIDLTQQWRDCVGESSCLALQSTNDLPGLAEAFAIHDRVEVELQPESHIRLDGDTEVCGQVDLSWILDGYEVGTASLEINGDHSSLEGMRLVSDLQSLGIGRRVVGQLVDLSVALGLAELRTLAAQIGRYAWARCGFDFAEDEVREAAISAATEVAERLERDLDVTRVRHSWDLAQMPGEPIPTSVATELFGGDLPGNSVESVAYGKALLLGPQCNDWEGCLTLAEGCPSRVQIGR